MHAGHNEHPSGHRDGHHSEPAPSFWKSPAGICLLAVAAVAGYFLLAEHRAHLAGWLPYILLALCPLMHIFMHGGHGHDGHGRSGQEQDADDGTRDRAQAGSQDASQDASQAPAQPPRAASSDKEPRHEH